MALVRDHTLNSKTLDEVLSSNCTLGHLLNTIDFKILTFKIGLGWESDIF